VCDAGGSTIDTTAYHVVKTTPVLELRESKASACKSINAFTGLII
jgi:hypothetical protein